MTQSAAERQSLERLFPIVRCPRRFGGKREMLYIDFNKLLIGSVKNEITEELLRGISEGKHRATLVEVPLEEIRLIRRERHGYLSPSVFSMRYTIVGGSTTYQFWLENNEAGNVDRALRLLLGDRFDPHVRRCASATERALLKAAILVAACLALGACHWSFLIAGAVLGLGAGFTAWGMRDARDAVRTRASHPVRAERLGPAGRQPFRSTPLGWILKLAGIFWIIILFWFGWVEGFSAYLAAAGSSTVQYVAFVLYLPGLDLLWRGYRMCLRSFEPGQHPDPRAPILYLRGFADDGHCTFQPAGSMLHGITGTIFEYGFAPIKARVLPPIWLLHPIKLWRVFLNEDRASAEEVLACAFRHRGPLVAIGQPGERLATPGADRMYVSDDVWQQVVLDYLDRCQAVVCQPSNTEGILWEVEQVFARVNWNRILLIMRHFRDRPDEYEDFRAWLDEKFGLRLPISIPFIDGPCFVYYEIDNTPRIQRICVTSPFLWSFTNNAVDAPNTFHTFIQGLDGEPREQPRQPRNRSFQVVLSMLIPTALLSFVIFGGYLLRGLR
jgi:hypothetical protein